VVVAGMQVAMPVRRCRHRACSALLTRGRSSGLASRPWCRSPEHACRLAGGRFSGRASRLAGSAPAPQGMRQPLALPRLSGTAPAALLPGAPSARARPAHPSPTTTQSTTTSTTHHPPSTPDATTTPSAIAAPMPLPAPIGPLPPQLQSQFAIGGSLKSNMALSPAHGGGGKTLADSMGSGTGKPI
jgi:hypothetical protein